MNADGRRFVAQAACLLLLGAAALDAQEARKGCPIRIELERGELIDHLEGTAFYAIRLQDVPVRWAAEWDWPRYEVPDSGLRVLLVQSATRRQFGACVKAIKRAPRLNAWLRELAAEMVRAGNGGGWIWHAENRDTGQTAGETAAQYLRRIR